MKSHYKFLIASCLLISATGISSKVSATPFVVQGPFVQPIAGPNIPGPRNVPGKEYSDRYDIDDQQPIPVNDQEQNLYWDGNGGRQNTFDFSGTRPNEPVQGDLNEVDALANHLDVLFSEVIANQAALLFSTGSTTLPANNPLYQNNPAYNQIGIKEGSVLYEAISGASDVWATPAQINADGVVDIDALEVWTTGASQADLTPDDGDMYSLLNDPLIDGVKTSVWYYNPITQISNSYLTTSQIAAAIGRPNFSNIIDLDGLMVYDQGDAGVWDDSDRILFSVMPFDTNGDGVITPNVNGGDIDGGEIWSLQRNSTGPTAIATFLNHGGHIWDTAFNVKTTFGTLNENIDALEAVATNHTPIPESSSSLSLIGLGLLGVGTMVKRKLNKVI